MASNVWHKIEHAAQSRNKLIRNIIYYFLQNQEGTDTGDRTLINFMIPPMNGVPSKIGGDLAGRLLLMNLKITRASRAMPVPTAYSRGRGRPLTLASNSPRSSAILFTVDEHRGFSALLSRPYETSACYNKIMYFQVSRTTLRGC